MALEDAKNEVDGAFTRQDRRGLSFENAFGGAVSFLRRHYSKDLTGADLAVTGVPFDQAVTHRTGTRFGPRAIREASTLQPYDPPYGWGFDPLGAISVVDYGDLAFDYAKTADFPARLKAHIGGILAGALLVLLFRRRGVPLFDREIVAPAAVELAKPDMRGEATAQGPWGRQ